MTIVVAVSRDERDIAALHLAGMIARASGDDVVACTVVPAPWPAGMARVDAEYQAYLAETSRTCLERARQTLPSDVSATFVSTHARSVPAGLLQVAHEHDATMLVVGSSPSGALGRVTVGSVAEWLLHTSPVSLAVAPRGFRARPGAATGRVTAAFAAAGSEDLVVAAGRVAATIGASLRIASFAVRPRTMLTAGVGSRAEDAVVREWVENAERAQREALRRVADLPAVPQPMTTVVGYGHDWAEALADIDWVEDDILVVGSSSAGPVARVFLGSHASKIVRHSPVPVVVVPQGRIEELVDAPAAE